VLGQKDAAAIRAYLIQRANEDKAADTDLNGAMPASFIAPLSTNIVEEIHAEEPRGAQIRHHAAADRVLAVADRAVLRVQALAGRRP